MQSDPGQVPFLPWACFLTCEMGGLGQSTSCGSPWRIWLVYISPVCLCLQTCLFPGSWGCRGQLHPTDREAEVQWGEVTYFPGSWPFPSSSFLVAKVPLDAEAGPCRGLCYGAQSGGRELRVSGLRVKCSLDPRRRSTACWSWVLGACGSWSRTRSTPSSSTWR